MPKISSPNDQFNAVSGAGGPPPCALSDTDVNLSAHPAPIIQPSVFNAPLSPDDQVLKAMRETAKQLGPKFEINE